MKPILFNTEMVRAILEGRKTVTRRVVKLPSHVVPQYNGLYTLYAEGTCYENQHLEQLTQYIKSPYQVNDILWVRETWRELIRPIGEPKDYAYKADVHNAMMSVFNGLWRPSIHMPKEAARIFLRVTGVRVERLQDICNRGSLQDHVTNITREGLQYQAVMENYQKLIDDFKQLWDSTIKKDQLKTYGWKANPFVWVIEFEVISKSEALGGSKGG